MKTIAICDATLKSAAAARLSFRERVEIARHLEGMGVDAIELAAIREEKPDTLFVRTLSTFVHNATLVVECGLTAESVRLAQAALARAPKARLQIHLPVSAAQMEYVCQMKPAALLQRLQELCVLCKELCADVEFVAADATRADADTLHRALQIALEAGVGRITLCDAAGLQLPDEMASMLQTLYAALPALADVQLGIACGNTLYMSCAGAVAAVQSGATVIKTAVVGDACPTPEAVSALMQARGDQLGWQCGLQQAQIRRLSKQIRWIADTRRSEGSPFDAGVRNPGEAPMLGRGEDAAQVETTVRSLGYDLTAEDMARVQEAIRGVSTHKTLTAQELEVIINTVALQVPPTYVLRDYAVHTSDVISASAQITLQKQDRTLQGISLGDGPIDASFLAIEQILGRHFEVDDFQIQAVTQGREAMGSALVKLRSHGKVYAGSGVSTDIIGASIRAYLNALNKIVYEETAL